MLGRLNMVGNLWANLGCDRGGWTARKSKLSIVVHNGHLGTCADGNSWFVCSRLYIGSQSCAVSSVD